MFVRRYRTITAGRANAIDNQMFLSEVGKGVVWIHRSNASVAPSGVFDFFCDCGQTAPAIVCPQTRIEGKRYTQWLAGRAYSTRVSLTFALNQTFVIRHLQSQFSKSLCILYKWETCRPVILPSTRGDEPWPSRTNPAKITVRIVTTFKMTNTIFSRLATVALIELTLISITKNTRCDFDAPIRE